MTDLSKPQVAAPNHRMQREFYQQLRAIADWWLAYGQDLEHGGFYGQVNADNSPEPDADKSVVLNTRILWFFSELAGQVDKPEYRTAARRAYDYLLTHFVDAEYGGVVWSLDARGQLLDGKKQIYAQAFAIYALTAYHQLTGEQSALDQARACFELVEKYGVDRRQGGYLEAFSRDWGALDDVRLSDRDLNFPKTMNTHLHVVEAYTSLHKADPSSTVRDALAYSIQCFDRHIIDKQTFHLRMFMGMDWTDHSRGVSYGHDIECSWLLAKALDSLADAEVEKAVMPTAIRMAEVCLAEAMGEQGEMLDVFDFASGSRQTERVWWVQAEALVGFINAYAMTGKEEYWRTAKGVWHFIQQYQIDDGGEWLWLSRLDKGCRDHYKAGFWKGPYHTGRAMLEAWRYLNKLGPLA